MSEFKIVKCKKCNAALVELAGEKLTSCVQCGYAFNIIANENKRPHAISKRIKDSPEFKRYFNKIRNNNNTALAPSNESSNQLSSAPSVSSGKPTVSFKKQLLEKSKKKSIWVTILMWYFILSFSIGVLKNIF